MYLSMIRCSSMDKPQNSLSELQGFVMILFDKHKMFWYYALRIHSIVQEFRGRLTVGSKGDVIFCAVFCIIQCPERGRI